MPLSFFFVGTFIDDFGVIVEDFSYSSRCQFMNIITLWSLYLV